MSLRSHAVCKHAPSHRGGEQPEAGWGTSRSDAHKDRQACGYGTRPTVGMSTSHTQLFVVHNEAEARAQSVVSVLSRERPLSRYANGVTPDVSTIGIRSLP